MNKKLIFLFCGCMVPLSAKIRLSSDMGVIRPENETEKLYQQLSVSVANASATEYSIDGKFGGTGVFEFENDDIFIKIGSLEKSYRSGFLLSNGGFMPFSTSFAGIQPLGATLGLKNKYVSVKVIRYARNINQNEKRFNYGYTPTRKML